MVAGSSLADGQLAATKTTIFTAATVTYVKAVMFTNVGVSTETILVYGKRLASTSRRLRTIVLGVGQSYRLFGKDDAYSMSTGDEIEAETTNALSVDFIVTGGI